MYHQKTKFWTAILSAAGAAVALVALYEHVIYRYGLAKGPSFCNISQHINCEAVNASEWSVFFGLPVAAYGLFFYVAILGLLWVSGPTRAVSDSRANQVVFVSGVIGSICSLALFAISEFIIGALCLLCVVVYLVSFLLVAVSWWGAGTGFYATFVGGVRDLSAFVVSIARGERAAVAGAVSVLLWGVLAAAAPTITYSVALAVRGADTSGEGAALAVDPLRAWREAPLQQIPVALDAGAFGDYGKGQPGAPIQIVEFADFECPGCRSLHVALQPVLEKFAGRYHFIFKNYPLDSACNAAITRKFHDNACFAAHFVRCAGEQGRFWEALDYAFTDPVLEHDGELDDLAVAKVREAMLVEGAGVLGLDAQGLGECVRADRYLTRIRQEVRQGDELGLRSTPSLWVNGRRVERPTPAALEQIFTTILAEQGLR